MAEDHEPKKCSECGTINPWMNTTCRDCGAQLSHGASSAKDENAPEDRKPTEESASPQGRAEPKRVGGWNPRWVLVGGALFALLFLGGEKLIEHFIVANDPVLKQIIEQQLQKQSTAEDTGGQGVSESDKRELRGALMSNRALVLSGVLLFLMTPLLVGGLVGYFTRAIRNGAVSCGLGMVAVMLLSTNKVLYGLVFGLVYAGLGALGALVGRRLRARRSSVASPR
jgi:hypothetical protein